MIGDLWRRERRVDAVRLVAATMQQAVQALRELRVPVCFEQVPLDPERADRLPDGRIEYERTRFDVVVPAGRVGAALAALCAADPDYAWERIGRTAVVYPARGGVLGWAVPPGAGVGRDWRTALGDIGLDRHGISVFPRGLDRQPAAELPRSLRAGGSARWWLTSLVDQLDNGRHWTLGGVAGSRSLVIGQV
nr:hypothetical protein [Micromonospora sp. DSM 115978]